MVSTGRNVLLVAPHVATVPGLAIMLAVLAFNLVGDGLRDALDPRLDKRPVNPTLDGKSAEVGSATEPE
jgi:ABC-type dipeptide/oligopeptide/nickel transport system permease subunit